MRGSDTPYLLLFEKFVKEPITQLSGRGLDAHRSLLGMGGSMAAANIELEIVSACKTNDQDLVCVGLCATDSMMKMRNREHQP